MNNQNHSSKESKQERNDKNRSVYSNKLNEIKEKLKSELPNDFSNDAIDYICDFWKDHRYSKIEYGQVFNYETGESLGDKFKGICSSVTIEFLNIDETSSATIHNHPIIGFSAPSGDDFAMAMEQWWNKYVVVVSLFEIWVIEASNFSTIEERIKITLDINMGLNKISSKLKFQEFLTKELRFNEANKMAGNFIKDYIIKNKQYGINVYQVIL